MRILKIIGRDFYVIDTLFNQLIPLNDLTSEMICKPLSLWAAISLRTPHSVTYFSSLSFFSLFMTLLWSLWRKAKHSAQCAVRYGSVSQGKFSSSFRLYVRSMRKTWGGKTQRKRNASESEWAILTVKDFLGGFLWLVWLPLFQRWCPALCDEMWWGLPVVNFCRPLLQAL